MDECPHINEIARLQRPKLSQAVHREECTRCFDDQDTEAGIDICLSCFDGGCLSPERHHAATHVAKKGHHFSLNVKRKMKPSSQRAEDQEPPAKITKLAIVQDREEDKYDHVTVVKCWKCDASNGREIHEESPNAQIKDLIHGVMTSMSSARQSEVQAWEEEILVCEHTLTLQQYETGHISAEGLAHCSQCDLKTNLWLCMTCGSLGCGRSQFGGTGGNGHGLEHFKSTGHGVSVKLGTITAEGGADIYCYICDDGKQDPEVKAHLATFGINIHAQKKTEKSMTELQIEQNLNYEFSLVGDDGKALQPVSGPGLTGLNNLGNSCYMASVIQTLFSLPKIQKRYSDAAAHWSTCTVPLPADCIECQMLKLSDGLLSGRYAHPPRDVVSHGDDPVFQAGLKPSGFKALVGKGHAEFATMRQQDAEEFFTHLVTVLRRYNHSQRASDPDPTDIFTFGLEQRLQCRECQGVRYRVDTMDTVSVPVRAQENGKYADGKPIWEEIKLEECLDTLTGTEALEYSCPKCQKSVIATKQSRFATLPEVLVVHAKKFQLVGWVPTKLDIPLIVPPSDLLLLDSYIGGGLQATETELPNDVPVHSAPQFNESAMAQLEGMGFPIVRCQKALLATGNSNADAAMEWLFAHMDDPDIDDPIPAATGSTGAGGAEPSEDQISMLADMGFTAKQARKALRETAGDAERAVEWLFNHPDDTGEDAPASIPATTATPTIPGSSQTPAKYSLKAFISHKGPSVHSGHYVVHIKVLKKGETDEWVLFNDEKVVRADEESVKALKKLAYLYIFERV